MHYPHCHDSNQPQSVARNHDVGNQFEAFSSISRSCQLIVALKPSTVVYAGPMLLDHQIVGLLEFGPKCMRLASVLMCHFPLQLLASVIVLLAYIQTAYILTL